MPQTQKNELRKTALATLDQSWDTYSQPMSRQKMSPRTAQPGNAIHVPTMPLFKKTSRKPSHKHSLSGATNMKVAFSASGEGDFGGDIPDDGCSLSPPIDTPETPSVQVKTRRVSGSLGHNDEVDIGTLTASLNSDYMMQ